MGIPVPWQKLAGFWNQPAGRHIPWLCLISLFRCWGEAEKIFSGFPVISRIIFKDFNIISPTRFAKSGCKRRDKFFLPSFVSWGVRTSYDNFEWIHPKRLDAQPWQLHEMLDDEPRVERRLEVPHAFSWWFSAFCGLDSISLGWKKKCWKIALLLQ